MVLLGAGLRVAAGGRRACSVPTQRLLLQRPATARALPAVVAQQRRWLAGAPSPNPRVYLDVAIGAAEPQRITFELFAQTVPETAENFRALCTGEMGTHEETGAVLHFKDSLFHRIIPEFMAQGGDITLNNGEGGCSIHPEIEFPDENFRIKHSEAGLLAMANRGRHTNTSNFYITFDECTWLNSKHVVFGTVVDGLRVLRAIEAAGTLDGTPSETVTVVDCGEL